VRALRAPDGLAGAALFGVRAPPRRVRDRAGGGRLRRARSLDRRRLEGARPPSDRRDGRRDRRRSAPAAKRRSAGVHPDRTRLLERGHHPAERLARELGRRWELPVAALLARTGQAPRQRGASLVERRRNVRGAFAAKQAPKTVCLVDDVYTSGATASAAASALRKAGARTVEVVTFARALRLR
jgi:hypothetical protein